MQGNLLKETIAIFIKKVQKKKQFQPGEGVTWGHPEGCSLSWVFKDRIEFREAEKRGGRDISVKGKNKTFWKL